MGAGPAGLTAAIYLARFNLAIRIVDGGRKPLRNDTFDPESCGLSAGHLGQGPAAPDGPSGQALRAQIVKAEVERLERCADNLFLIPANGELLKARTVLLATGVVNNRPPISEADHEIAVAKGLLRYCPICDGYEAADQTVGVIGTRTHGYNEAVFVRMYTSKVVLIAPEGGHVLTDGERGFLAEIGVRTVDGPCGQLYIDGAKIVAPTAQGAMPFDTVYPALGSVIRSHLALTLGAEATEEGCLTVDDHQRTTIPGLYAAGDVAKGLDQISHAMGQAGGCGDPRSGMTSPEPGSWRDRG